MQADAFLSTADPSPGAGPAAGPAAPPGARPRVAVKDLMDVRGMITTGGGRVLAAVPAERDAAVVARVRASGAVFVGKTHLDEFAYDVTGDNAHYGHLVHPSDPARIPGGSSGGSAVAVALGLCDWAIGTDTAGSIRIPAALCGLVGVKPTAGLVPSAGVFPLSPTLDTVGPLAEDVRTAADALRAMAALPAAPPLDRAPRLAAPEGWVEGLDDGVARVWASVSAGLREVPFPAWERFQEPFQRIVLAEATAQHRHWLDTRPQDYGPFTLANLRAGLQIGAADYLAAKAERARLADEIDRALTGLDALVLPATCCVAPLRGSGDVRALLGRFTSPFSLTGHPAVVVPAPDPGPLPVGVQLVGRRGDDAALLRVAAHLERAWR